MCPLVHGDRALVNPCRMRTRFFVVIGLFWLGGSSTLRAYVLPADALCRMYADVRRSNGVRDVTLQLNADLLGHDHQVDERLYMRKAERGRLVQQDDVTTERIDREGQSTILVDKMPSAALVAGPTSLLPAIMFPRGATLDELSQRLYKTLQAAGLQMSLVSFARQGETVAYVIGAHAYEPNRAQIWLDKQTFQLLRVVTLRRQGDVRVTHELRLLEYGKGPAGTHFPKFFEEYEDGKLTRRSEVTGAHLNQDLPETLFDWSARRR